MSELEKIAKVREQSDAIGGFIEWLRDNGYAICHWGENGYLVYSGKTVTAWLEEYFEIDGKKAEQERKELLRKLGNTNA